MTALRLSMLIGAISLPIIVSFGWNLLRRIFGYNRNHHIVAMDEEPEYLIEDMDSEKDEIEIVGDYCEQFKDGYTDDYYC